MSNPELHLFIIWEKARFKETAILDDLRQNTEILEVFEVEWSKKYFSANLTRFYGQKLPPRSSKEKRCGNGKFLLITVLNKDEPVYDFIDTSRGTEYVNVKMFGLKQKYREWTGGGDKIHATNSPLETNHDITLLLGINADDYLKRVSEVKWNNQIKPFKKDLAGFNGWKNIEELFYVLNATTKYIVLRNYECLPEKFTTKEHGDVDLLVEDFEDALFVANAEKVFPDRKRVHCYTHINGEKVYFDFRYLGDNYYCRQWEKNLLKKRTMHKICFYVSDQENYFYTLIYHALFHKKYIAEDYYKKLEHLFLSLKLDIKYNLGNYINPFDLYYELLMTFMYKHRYFVVKPSDRSVYFDEKYLNSEDIKDYLCEYFKIKEIKQVNINKHRNGSGYVHFSGLSKDNNKLFIKWGGVGESPRREYETLQELYHYNPDNFPKPYYYKNRGFHKFLAIEFINGTPLNLLIEKKMLTEEMKRDIVQQLQRIADTLLSTALIHRDLKPDNLILSKENKLYLIDNQYCIDKSLHKFPELNIIRDYPRKFRWIGTQDFVPGEGKWDDMWSILKIIELLDDNASKKYPEIYQDIASKIGRLEYDLRKTCSTKLIHRLSFLSKIIVKFKALRNVVQCKYFIDEKKPVPLRLEPIYELARDGAFTLYELYRIEYKRLKSKIL